MPCPYKRHCLDLGCGSHMWITWRVILRKGGTQGREQGLQLDIGSSLFLAMGKPTIREGPGTAALSYP